MTEKHTIILTVTVNDRVVAARSATAENLDIALLCAAFMKQKATNIASEIAGVVDSMRGYYEAEEPKAEEPTSDQSDSEAM